MYAVDLAMVITGFSRDDAGKVIRRLTEEIFTSDKMSERSMPGKGNGHVTPARLCIPEERSTTPDVDIRARLKIAAEHRA